MYKQTDRQTKRWLDGWTGMLVKWTIFPIGNVDQHVKVDNTYILAISAHPLALRVPRQIEFVTENYWRRLNEAPGGSNSINEKKKSLLSRTSSTATCATCVCSYFVMAL